MERIFKTIGIPSAPTVLVCAILFSVTASAELRAFRLKILDTATGAERTVISRLDDLQYRQYFAVKNTEQISIDQTWMCYRRSDFAGALCQAPEKSGPASGDQDRTPAGTPAGKLNAP